MRTGKERKNSLRFSDERCSKTVQSWFRKWRRRSQTVYSSQYEHIKLYTNEYSTRKTFFGPGRLWMTQNSQSDGDGRAGSPMKSVIAICVAKCVLQDTIALGPLFDLRPCKMFRGTFALQALPKNVGEEPGSKIWSRGISLWGRNCLKWVSVVRIFIRKISKKNRKIGRLIN